MKLKKGFALFLTACLISSGISMEAFAEETEFLQRTEQTVILIEDSAEEETVAEEPSVSENEISEEATDENVEETVAAETEIIRAEEEAETKQEAIELTAAAEDGMTVILYANADAFENEGELSLSASLTEIIGTEEEEELEAAEQKNVAKRVTYDITVYDGESPIEPVKEVKVSFKFPDAPSGADGVSIYHHVENDGIEKIADRTLKGDAEDVIVKTAVDSFSFYTVDFTYKDMTVSIDGDTKENRLDDIAGRLGIHSKVIDAGTYQEADCSGEETGGEVKNTKGVTLFSVYESEGEWYLDAENAFNTVHGLIIRTEEGAEYQIMVKDSAEQSNDDCITFTSTGGFTLKTNNGSKNWNGKIYYSTDKTSWAEWKGKAISAAQTGGTGNYNLYVRGDSGNTIVTGWGNPRQWMLTPASADGKIACTGNIETLRGATGDDPSPTAMGAYCYNRMFCMCTSLTSSPDLTATTLGTGCYYNMFALCSGLLEAPELPATELTYECYFQMFQGCSSLTEAPELPATEMESRCYRGMFNNCTGLQEAPDLPSVSLASECYWFMFNGCTNLREAPALPATEMFSGCYRGMFVNCISLQTAPELPAMTVVESCYREMFYGCTSLVEAPDLPATTIAGGSTYRDMFNGCTSLATVYELPALTVNGGCYQAMFKNCASLTAVPALKAESFSVQCYMEMFCGCTNLEISAECGSGMELLFSCPGGFENNEITNMFSGTIKTGIDNTPAAGNYYAKIVHNPKTEPEEEPAEESQDETPVPVSMGSYNKLAGKSQDKTRVPVSMGSSDEPVREGYWSEGPGLWQYLVNGRPVKKAFVWIEYVDADGNKVKGCFFFDKHGYMAVGWKLINGKWYYFNATDPRMLGTMLSGTTTPDGYKVDENGAWIEE